MAPMHMAQTDSLLPTSKPGLFVTNICGPGHHIEAGLGSYNDIPLRAGVRGRLTPWCDSYIEPGKPALISGAIRSTLWRPSVRNVDISFAITRYYFLEIILGAVHILSYQ